MKIEIDKISQKIKQKREERKITQQALANELGVSRQSIIALEQGRCLPSLPLALEISRVFDETLESLFLDMENEINKLNNLSQEVQMPRHLQPWSPFRELNSLHDTIDQLFEESMPALPRQALPVPMINVYEQEQNVIIEAEMPGVKEEDLSIELGEDQLILRGEKKQIEEQKEKNYYRRETVYGSFARAIALPSDIDKDKAEAELKDGILKITLPKMPAPEPKVKKIQVKKS